MSFYCVCEPGSAGGAAAPHLDVFSPIRETVRIEQKTVKHAPSDKLYDAFISLLAGAHGLVEINSRLRADPVLQRAFGRGLCAEQSVVQRTLDACTATTVKQMEQAMDMIYPRVAQRVLPQQQSGLRAFFAALPFSECRGIFGLLVSKKLEY